MKFVTEKAALRSVPNAVVYRNVNNGTVHCLKCDSYVTMYDLDVCRNCGNKLDPVFVGDVVICHKVKTVFENNDVVYALLGYEGGSNRQQGDRLFLRPVTLRLKLRSDGKVVVKDGTKTIRGIELLTNIINRFKHNFAALKDYDVSDYYMANNHRLKDLLSLLPSQESYWYEASDKQKLARSLSVFFENTTPTTRARIYRNYDKYGTKGANTSLLYNKGNKVLNKLAWEYLGAAQYLGALLKNDCATADQVVHFLKDIHRNNVGGVISYISAACLLGYSFKKAVNMYKKEPVRVYSLDQTARDSYMMLTEIKKTLPEYTVELGTDLNRIHDILSRDYNMLREMADDKIALPTHRYKGVETDKYTLKSAETGGDLIRCGNQMNICVGSYTNLVMGKSCEIYIVYDDFNIPVVCIEVANKTINQAKLKANKQVVSNPELFHLVRDWADSHELRWAACHDMGYTYTPDHHAAGLEDPADQGIVFPIANDADDLPF